MCMQGSNAITTAKVSPYFALVVALCPVTVADKARDEFKEADKVREDKQRELE